MSTPEQPISESATSETGGMFRAYSNLAAQYAAVVWLARHDGLTGLLNKQEGAHEIDRRTRGNQPFGLIGLDLDAFKLVNDQIGHNEGDRLLADFGEHSRSSYRRSGDVLTHQKIWLPVSESDREVAVARTGGDEFQIIVDLSARNHDDPLTPEERMENALEYGHLVFGEFVGRQDEAIKNLRFNISMAGGIWYPGSGESAEELVGRVDAAVYGDKRAHGAPAR
jgi:GGDEF domain-containing protein